MKIKQLAVRDPEMVEKLIDVWTRSVRARHTFLNEDDIRRLTPVVRQGLTEIPVLVTAETDEGGDRGRLSGNAVSSPRLPGAGQTAVKNGGRTV